MAVFWKLSHLPEGKDMLTSMWHGKDFSSGESVTFYSVDRPRCILCVVTSVLDAGNILLLGVKGSLLVCH